jgi:hypothetical protein
MNGGIQVSTSRGKRSFKQLTIITASFFMLVGVVGTAVFLTQLTSTDSRSSASDYKSALMTPFPTLTGNRTAPIAVSPTATAVKSTKNLYGRTCNFNTKTGSPEQVTCTAIEHMSLGTAELVIVDSASRTDSSTFANGTKVYQSYLSDDGKTQYSRICTEKESLSNSCKTPYTATGISNLRGMGNETYQAAKNQISLQGGVYKIRQFYITK